MQKQTGRELRITSPKLPAFAMWAQAQSRTILNRLGVIVEFTDRNDEQDQVFAVDSAGNGVYDERFADGIWLPIEKLADRSPAVSVAASADRNTPSTTLSVLAPALSILTQKAPPT